MIYVLRYYKLIFITTSGTRTEATAQVDSCKKICFFRNVQAGRLLYAGWHGRSQPCFQFKDFVFYIYGFIFTRRPDWLYFCGRNTSIQYRIITVKVSNRK